MFELFTLEDFGTIQYHQSSFLIWTHVLPQVVSQRYFYSGETRVTQISLGHHSSPSYSFKFSKQSPFVSRVLCVDTQMDCVDTQMDCLTLCLVL